MEGSLPTWSRSDKHDCREDNRRRRFKLGKEKLRMFSQDLRVTPHDDALVIICDIANFDVKSVLVNGGSAANVLTWDVFLGLKDLSGQVETSNHPLQGFGRAMVIPEGTVELSVMLSTGPTTMPAIAQHHLDVLPGTKLVKQKKRNFVPESQEVAKAEVDKLLQASFIREVQYLEWLANIVLVRKSNGKMEHVCRLHRGQQSMPKGLMATPSDRLPGRCHVRGTEVNLDKIQVILEMKSPTIKKEVERLTGRVAALNRFMSRATNKCYDFFRAIGGSTNFEWTQECEESLESLKKSL
ncbi:uncharacterized protein LOC111374448 [Olea europaea var. sylvestris]|uniref:uncharacterized protein LOC111374448 n=1 Tax=Olea europaea var. sylvestris TaxID=158386 RepID=UPI000C1D51F1|nr:uncharacterized protein LOC111374448 [Olea europaea var. sylvestris]